MDPATTGDCTPSSMLSTATAATAAAVVEPKRRRSSSSGNESSPAKRTHRERVCMAAEEEDTTTNRPRLVMLAAELLVAITEHLSRESCGRLVQTCKVLHDTLRELPVFRPSTYVLHVGSTKTLYSATTSYTRSDARLRAIRTLIIRESSPPTFAQEIIAAISGHLGRVLYGNYALKCKATSLSAVVVEDCTTNTALQHIARHLGRWCPRTLQSITIQFKAGFPEADTWEMIGKCTGLCKLHLYISGQEPYHGSSSAATIKATAGFAQLSTLSKLEELSLHSTSHTGPGHIIFRATVLSWPLLRSLTFSGCSWLAHDHFVGIVEHCRHRVTRLSFQNCSSITGPVTVWFATECVRLEYLSLQGMQLFLSDTIRTFEMHAPQVLHTLHIGGWHVSDRMARRLVRCMPRLAELKIPRTDGEITIYCGATLDQLRVFAEVAATGGGGGSGGGDRPDERPRV